MFNLACSLHVKMILLMMLWLLLEDCVWVCVCAPLPSKRFHSGVPTWRWREAAAAVRSQRWSWTGGLSACQSGWMDSCRRHFAWLHSLPRPRMFHFFSRTLTQQHKGLRSRNGWSLGPLCEGWKSRSEEGKETRINNNQLNDLVDRLCVCLCVCVVYLQGEVVY